MMITPAPVPTDLFGGALHVHLPSGYLDASTVREVPNTQEVFVPTTQTNTSITIDILEPPLAIAAASKEEKDTTTNPDLAALEIHWEDIVSPHASRVFSIVPVPVPGAQPPSQPQPHTPTRAWCIVGTVNDGGGGAGYTVVLATVVRLATVKTDLVVSVNVPISAAEAASEGSVCAPGAGVNVAGGRMGDVLRKGYEIRDQILSTLVIRDWGLFVN